MQTTIVCTLTRPINQSTAVYFNDTHSNTSENQTTVDNSPICIYEIYYTFNDIFLISYAIDYHHYLI